MNSLAMVAGRAGANRYATATPEVVADATGLGIEGVVVTGSAKGSVMSSESRFTCTKTRQQALSAGISQRCVPESTRGWRRS